MLSLFNFLEYILCKLRELSSSLSFGCIHNIPLTATAPKFKEQLYKLLKNFFFIFIFMLNAFSTTVSY